MKFLLYLLLFAVSYLSAINRTNGQTAPASKDTIPASFPGGIAEWRRYLERSLHYPETAQSKRTQGVVAVAMTITEQGKIINASALNDPGDGLAAEALWVVTEGPAWLPATVAGKPVSYSFKQKITFMLGAGISGVLPAGAPSNPNRFNQRIIIKTPRLYGGQAVDAIIPTYDRPGVTVQVASGRSFYLNSNETMQAFGIIISKEGFVVPEDASVVYYDNNAKAYDNWGGLKFVGGVQNYSIAPLLDSTRLKPDPVKIPIIWLDGKEVTVEKLQAQNRN